MIQALDRFPRAREFQAVVAMVDGAGSVGAVIGIPGMAAWESAGAAALQAYRQGADRYVVIGYADDLVDPEATATIVAVASDAAQAVGGGRMLDALQVRRGPAGAPEAYRSLLCDDLGCCPDRGRSVTYSGSLARSLDAVLGPVDAHQWSWAPAAAQAPLAEAPQQQHRGDPLLGTGGPEDEAPAGPAR
jgi:hypothetical protein